MEQWFQKAAVALLLSAPSTLHKAWFNDDAEACDRELDRLGFSAEAKMKALEEMAAIRDHVGFMHATSEVLRIRMWAGSEPHPSDADAARIVQALRELDGI